MLDSTSFPCKPNFFFLIIIILKFYLFFPALGLCCCVWAFSSCSERASHLWWLLLLRSTGSRHVGFSSCGSRALEHRLSSCGARALQHVGSSPTRDRSRVPCIGRQILNHCATREVPQTGFKNLLKMLKMFGLGKQQCSKQKIVVINKEYKGTFRKKHNH